MKEYVITITEVLERTVFINADNQEEAHERARADWNNGAFILDADDFVDVEFELKGELVC